MKIKKTATLKYTFLNLAINNIFKKVKLETKGINKDGIYLKHHRFVDDKILIEVNAQEPN